MPYTRLLSGATALARASLASGHFFAQFTPIPALAPALVVIQKILDECAQVHSNSKEINQLQERCQYLLLALADQEQSVSSDKMSQIVDGCTVHLNEVHKILQNIAGYTRWESFLRLQDISDDIKDCHSKIDACCREFEIRSHMQLHQWQNAFEAVAREDHDELVTLLTEIRADQQAEQQMIAEIGSHVLQLYQEQLRISKPDSKQYHAMERGLYHFQKRTGDLPPDTDLRAGEVRRIGKFPVDGNSAFDIWEGIWLNEEKVALKTIRGVRVSPDTRKRFQREVRIWREVWRLDRGRYFVPFYGACYEDGPFPYMASPWMVNGTVMGYLGKHPTADRRQIIKGIAKGLSILHNLQPKPIAHGDVKANVLIDDQGQPLLADFGLSKILEDVTGVPFTQSKGVSESYRWFAPELCCYPGVISMQSDVFAYAMTVVEIMTGEPPFAHIKLTTEVVIKMQRGERPMRPTDSKVRERGLDDPLWDILTRCWEGNYAKRPTIDEVLAEL